MSLCRVAVLMGGPSLEHEVSLRSGQGVVAALRQRHLDAEPLVIPQSLTISEATETTQWLLHSCAPDVVFIALHGAFGEDGTVQALCEQLQLPYTGSGPEASRLGMDKVASRQRFEQHGLRVPRWQVIDVTSGDSAASWRDHLRYPLVVKPVDQGSSVGVTIVQRSGELEAALQIAARYGSRVLVEECIVGREVTVGVLGEEPLPVVEIRPHQPFFNYTAKYTSGATEYLVPAPLSSALACAIQSIGLAAHRAIGCRHLSRADLMLDEREVPVLLEVNTIPGFTPTSLLPKAAACVGLSYEAVCERLIRLALTDEGNQQSAVSKQTVDMRRET